MSQLLFKDLNLSEEINRSITEMGFEKATEIQAKSIPVIFEGHDVIGKSQTGTGKTIAFGIPAIEKVEPKAVKGVQVLVLCPTRELAMQACSELRKLAKFKEGIKIADIYGGASMDSQIMRLKSANIVVGTPGRVMDHMRRRTLKLENMKMIVLDEADEMLSMGFREDIETILEQTPESRQTILFSATMPPEIFALTKKFQNSPKLVEVNKKQMTVENIEQRYYDVPLNKKMDALNLILKFEKPLLAMMFCNTKKMVEEVAEYLHKQGFSVEGLHGDMKQAQRNKVMLGFKTGKTNILVATDVAARGIDVSGIDYVINYDIPQNTEYYVHRIGRTGRAGKSGKSITMCSGRRQVDLLSRIGYLTKSSIKRAELPKVVEIKEKTYQDNLNKIKESLDKTEINNSYHNMVKDLIENGCRLEEIAALALQLHFGNPDAGIMDIKTPQYSDRDIKKSSGYKKIVINIGKIHKVAPNHIVGALTKSTSLSGKEIGKIEIFEDRTIVSVPEHSIDETVHQMKDCKICGTPSITKIHKNHFDNSRNNDRRYRGKQNNRRPY